MRRTKGNREREFYKENARGRKLSLGVSPMARTKRGIILLERGRVVYAGPRR